MIGRQDCSTLRWCRRSFCVGWRRGLFPRTLVGLWSASNTEWFTAWWGSSQGGLWMGHGFTLNWRRQCRRLAYRKWRPTSPAARRTRFHNKLWPGQLWTYFWRCSNAWVQVGWSSDGINSDLTWRGCGRRLGIRNWKIGRGVSREGDGGISGGIL